MACVLSRATRSIKLNLASAEHERVIAEAWCIEAAERCTVNTRKIYNGTYLPVYPKFTQISKNTCAAQGISYTNPINV